MAAYRKAGRILVSILIVYAALVASHEGEFWPFSIYPMFSQAGRPWTRALVREIPPVAPDGVVWQSGDVPTLPGKPFPVARHGIFQNDLANYISKTEAWTPDLVHGLEAMFRTAGINDRYLLIYKIRGSLEKQPLSVTKAAYPVALLTPDSLYFSPVYRDTSFSE